ncbi:hypothetical protein [Desulfobaculum bizertense]|uniref:Tetratricopeptide repeat-containing protein n=1 Tax=Desulfobaculum bizertense DSM 18034 TaxID=1121442 RepID=A0A1T4VCT8_9BACT|nr:hypothetical protein [Desulfobaculum bizertense]UIJ37565.1 hypothetical protein LWC08_12780 [Desulfobaculum bizertense]SKA62688.1 hypothetical protein SAMN02745702_00003 [Desulfobaculum bizertense DSM 18034]
MNPIMEMGQLNKEAMHICTSGGNLSNAEFLLRQALMRSSACRSPLPGAKIKHNLALVLTLSERRDEAHRLLSSALETVSDAQLEHSSFYRRIQTALHGLAA